MRTHVISLRTLAALAMLPVLFIAGCDLSSPNPPSAPSPGLNSYSAMGGGTAGVTTGGAQDIGAARAQIEAGMVPAPRLITFEGLFSEHDFAVPPSGCEETICLSPGVAVYQPLGSDTTRVLIHVSMSSNIDAATFRHAPMQTVIIVDRSGSMGGFADSDGTSKMTAVKDALAQLIGVLTDADEIGLISFNSDHNVDVALGPLNSDQRTAALRETAAYQAGGSTDIESPLRHAFEILDEAPVRAGYQRRVLLLTDALPNTGRTDEDDFLTLAERYAERGIGLTAFGVGLDFGAELAREISEIRGGNYVFLRDGEAIERIFSENVEFLLTPVAYDFSLEVNADPGLELANVYGMPGGNEGEFSMSAATLFLSSSKGAIGVEFVSTSGTLPIWPLAELTLRYTPATGGGEVTRTLRPAAADLGTAVSGIRASDAGVRKLAALVNMGRVLRESLGEWESGQTIGPMESIGALEAHLHDVAAQLQDTSLEQEADLVAMLRANMSEVVRTASEVAQE